MVTWAKDRKGELFFPLDDSRALPTKAVLIIMDDLFRNHVASKHWQKMVKRAMDRAPEAQWGRLEETAAALMAICSRMDKNDAMKWLAPVQRNDVLIKAAAFLQKAPHLLKAQMLVHEVTPASLLPRLYTRLEKEGEVAMQEAALLSASESDHYLVWLSDGRAIRKDWQWSLWKKVSFHSAIRPYVESSNGAWIPLLALLLAAVLLHSVLLSGHSLNAMVWPSILFWAVVLLGLEWQMASSDLSLELQWKALPQMSSVEQDPSPEMINNSMESLDHRTLQLILFFLGLQVLVFILSCLSIRSIDKKGSDPLIKIKLLDNDEYLYDLGLYIGLGGTVMSLIFLAMGQESQGMMAAYTSTLFGILEVALFKVIFLRPYRQNLIVQA
jgi:hypothetical protein